MTKTTETTKTTEMAGNVVTTELAGSAASKAAEQQAERAKARESMKIALATWK